MALHAVFHTREALTKGDYCVGPPKEGHIEKRKRKTVAAVSVLKWNEADHPRDKANGRFTEDGSGSTGSTGTGSTGTGSHKKTPKHLTAEQRAAQHAFALRSRKKVHQVETPEEGVALILKGENVVLKDTKDVHTVLSKLGALAIEAKNKCAAAAAAGQKCDEKQVNFDPCQISVKGTNLFCSETIKTKDFPHGIPRIEMPQFKSKNPVPGSFADSLPRDANGEVDATDAFMKYLDELGVETNSYDTVLAKKLKASQGEMEGAKVAGMMLASQQPGGRDPKTARIIISGDSYVVDGHHTWAASVGRDAEDGNLDNDKEMDAVRIMLPMSEIYHLSVEWTRRNGLPQAGVKKRDYATVLKYFRALSAVS